MRIALTLPLLTFVILPMAAGAASFAPPKGCTLDLTMQSRGCVVANYYHCEGDQPGDRWTAFADQAGIFYVNKIDAETRWLESYSPVTGVRDRLIPDAHDHASLKALLGSGRDDFDFAVMDSNGDLRRYKGSDTLTGETRTIDGLKLEVTDFEVRSFDAGGALMSTRIGRQYVSHDERLFFGGTETFEEQGQPPVKTVEDPVSFARPGEPGFGEATPHYDCDLLMTGRPTGQAG